MNKKKRNGRGYLYLLYLRIIRIRAEPREIALGLALGVFIGSLPIIPFQTIAVVILAILFKASKIAGFLGTFVTNPVTMLPFYLLLWYVGSFFIPHAVGENINMSDLSLENLIAQGPNIFLAMMLGGIIVGLPAGIVTFFTIKPLLEKYKKRRNERKRKKVINGKKNTQTIK
ncbi:MAG: DUF2062 domain-containing protein [Desulfovibrionaceae bacterium]